MSSLQDQVGLQHKRRKRDYLPVGFFKKKGFLVTNIESRRDNSTKLENYVKSNLNILINSQSVNSNLLVIGTPYIRIYSLFVPPSFSPLHSALSYNALMNAGRVLIRQRLPGPRQIFLRYETRAILQNR